MYVLELERTLTYIIRWIQRVINARDLVGLIHVHLLHLVWHQAIEVAIGFVEIARLATYYTVVLILQYFTIIVKEIQENVSQVNVLRCSDLVQLSELDECNYHK